MEIAAKYQTFKPRVNAALVDGLVFFLPSLLVRWSYTLDLPPLTRLAIFVVDSSIRYVYSVAMHGVFGQTLGKMVTKVRVVDLTETKLSFRQAVLRDSVAIILDLLFIGLAKPQVMAGVDPRTLDVSGGVALLTYLSLIWYVAEFVTMLFSRKRRSLHDLLAGSVVIRCS